MKYRRFLFFYIIFFTGILLSFGFGYLIRAVQDESSNSSFPVLDQAYKILESAAYYDLPEKNTFEYAMIHKMMETYGDSYSRFEEPITHELNTNQLEGKFGGIGASLEQNKNGELILHPFPGGPADQAGILSGDIITQIDDWQISPYSDMDAVIAAIRGPEGHIVNISVRRPTTVDELSFTIIREEYLLPSVTWHQIYDNPWVGILKINIISATSIEEIQHGIDDLDSRGVTHFVIDLRDNRGGLLSAGIDIARLFLEEGIVIQEHYRDEETTTYSVIQPGNYSQIPLVIFVNANTASAAEIIAGALKAHGRATIVGTPTFGKDSIQLIFDLMDHSSLHVTAAKWWVPGLNPPVGEGGLQPDILIDPEINIPDPYIQSALQVLEKRR
jgi:carboxyl-terminal processing protease